MSAAFPAPEASHNINSLHSNPRSTKPGSDTSGFLTWEAAADPSRMLPTLPGGTRHSAVTPTIWSVKSLPPTFSSF
jgi:hypothetical protein